MNALGFTQEKDDVLELISYLPPEPQFVNYISICKEMNISPRALQILVNRANDRSYGITMDTGLKTIWLDRDGWDIAQADAEQYLEDYCGEK